MQYVTDDLIVFISGCNLILYDLSLRKQKFLLKKNEHRRITFLSVGNTKPSLNQLEIKNSQKNLSSININPDSESENFIERN